MNLTTSEHPKAGPIPQESLIGFLRRYGDYQGYPRIEDFLASNRLTYGRPLIENLNGLATIIGVETSLLKRSAPEARPRREAMAWRFHRAHSDPFCPECLRGDGIWRTEWRHGLVTACAAHEIVLVDTCPSCHERVSISVGGWRSCDCGQTFSAISSDQASAMEIKIAEILSGSSATLCGVDLNSDDDSDLIKVIWFLATSMTDSRTGKPGKSGFPKSVAEARDLIARAEAVLTEFPRSFDEFVMELWNRAPAGNTAAQRLGPWYHALMKQKGALARHLQDRVRIVISTRAADPYAPRDDECAGSEWISAATAAKRLRVRPDRIVDAVANGDIAGKLFTSGMGHRHTQIARTTVEALQKDRQRALAKTEAMSLLGCSKKQLELLIDAGVVGHLPKSDVPLFAAGTLDRGALLATIERIRRGVQRNSEASGAIIAFRDINMRRTTDLSALKSLFSKISNGELRAVAFAEGAPLGDACFDAKEVDDVLADGGASVLMTARDIARLTGWKPECITHWCAEGLISAKYGRVGGADAWLIKPEALAEFQATYLVLSDLAAKNATTSRSILRELQNRNVATVGMMRVGSTTRGHLLPVTALGQLF